MDSSLYLIPYTLHPFLQNPEQGASLQPLVTEDHQTSLRADLDLLDSLDSRPADTLHIYYVRKGQTKSADILSNVVSGVGSGVRSVG